MEKTTSTNHLPSSTRPGWVSSRHGILGQGDACLIGGGREGQQDVSFRSWWEQNAFASIESSNEPFNGSPRCPNGVQSGCAPLLSPPSISHHCGVHVQWPTRRISRQAGQLLETQANQNRNQQANDSDHSIPSIHRITQPAYFSSPLQFLPRISAALPPTPKRDVCIAGQWAETRSPVP
jgi:hypothetical protein